MAISINIEVGGHTHLIDIIEARTIYNELSIIFGNSNMINDHYNPYDIIKEPGISQQQNNTRIVNNNHKNDSSESTSTLNPKVEEARQRAAKRTSGCGARR